MKKYNNDFAGELIFMGLDLHRNNWHLTVRTQNQEIDKMNLPPQWDNLRKIIDRFGAGRVAVVYEAGYFGFALHDQIRAHGARCVVTPPSLIPQESGNRVKTDKIDSRKLARLLAKEELKSVHVPSVGERNHRQVLRHRNQLVKDRTRVQLRIKSFLAFHGVACPEGNRKWSGRFLKRLAALELGSPYLQECFSGQLEEYAFLNAQIFRATKNLRQISQLQEYRESFVLLRTIPGVGLLTAMEILLELGDMSRFPNAERLAAYVGLTPSQHSTGDKVRMGRITGMGKHKLRGTLTEAAWVLIRKDGSMAQRYERIKLRSGGKRAIVAVAHNLLLRIRRVLINRVPYSTGVVG
jgi:transposase